MCELVKPFDDRPNTVAVCYTGSRAPTAISGSGVLNVASVRSRGALWRELELCEADSMSPDDDPAVVFVADFGPVTDVSAVLWRGEWWMVCDYVSPGGVIKPTAMTACSLAIYVAVKCLRSLKALRLDFRPLTTAVLLVCGLPMLMTVMISKDVA